MLRAGNTKIIETLLTQREGILTECTGCKRIEEDTNLCLSYVSPKAKWRMGHCNLATHVVIEQSKIEERKRAGQQKSKKKSRK